MSPSHVGDRFADPYYQCVSWLHGGTIVGEQILSDPRRRKDLAHLAHSTRGRTIRAS